ncbi:MAG: sigma-54 dependent transcriptional regulator [Myxococcota bacterium]
MPRALVVDDDPEILRPLAKFVEREGFATRTCDSLAKARRQLAKDDWDVVIADLTLPDGTALELLAPIEQRSSTEVVLITGHGSVDSAVEAFRGGAIDYLTKPIDTGRLRGLLRKLLRTIELRDEVDLLRAELRRAGRFGKMIGASPPMQKLYDEVLQVAPTAATVLLTGETGTGKELVAESIHQLSPRAKRPFVAMNCGAVAASLIESELFGHERGSFTGATQRHRGVFERADGGTLLLDEIIEMPPDLQVRLLRTLESKRVLRIGSEKEIEVDVRVLAATNRDPEKAVREGKLREDLLYRLFVFPIEVPPLRERGNDIVLISEHVLAQLNGDAETPKRFTQDALDRLCAQPWPGNVRELRNAVERAFILARDRIGVEHLPFGTEGISARERAATGSPVGTSLTEAERELILTTVHHYAGDKNEAARVLGISLKTLYNRLHKYGAMES